MRRSHIDHIAAGYPQDEDKCPVCDAGLMLQRYARQLAEQRIKAEEEWCERSLTDPAARGVLVKEHGGPIDYTIELSSTVPYGEVHVQRLPPRLQFHP